MSKWTDIADVASAVEEGGVARYETSEAPIALFKVDGHFHALHDLCTHGPGRLSDGYVDGACVECPLHQGLIEIATGQPKAPPVVDPIRSFPVRVVDGRIEVEI